MPIVTFLPSKTTIDVTVGTELLDAARMAGVEIDSPCGGKGTCGKCTVRMISGKVDYEDLGVLPPSAVIDGFVLACKTKILSEDISVEIPQQVGRTNGKFGDSCADADLVRHELLPRVWQYDPLAVKWLLNVAPPELNDGLSDLDRITLAIQHDWGKKAVNYPLSVIQQAADALREENGLITATIIRRPDCYHIIDITSGDTTTKSYGIAIDIGTTTIAVQLVYLPLSKIVATKSDYNDQVDCGLDVISRINYARRPERLKELQDRVLQTINRLILQTCEVGKISPADLCNAVVSGNTTMVHLLLGLQPEYIRLDPYTPTVLDVPYISAEDIGININPKSWIYVSPNVGSYVGGDITAGLLCTDLVTDTEEVNLFIDIGTNGEIVVGNSEFLMTCACSAGPAFEGGGIEYGMRAARGAIERVQVDVESGLAIVETIDNAPAVGVCGSGMISLLAELFLTGWIDAAGKFDRTRESAAIEIDGRAGYYTIVTADESSHGKAIRISEIDIENIVRAKAAIYSACALMLEQLGMDFDDLSTVYIAGGFGRFLDLEKAKIIGLVPDLPKEKFVYLGNSSLVGSYMVLISDEFRIKQIETAKRMTYMELSTDPSYMDQYTGALFLPHTDPNRFSNVLAAKKKRCGQ